MFTDRMKRPPAQVIAISAMMAAIVAVLTYSIAIPIPATSGYLNIGDAAVFTAALIFGPIVGGFAGGVGSAIADILLASAFAPYTLAIKGLEGMLVGLVSNGKDTWRNIVGVGIGGAVMITGYFLAESFPLGYGVSAALVEVPFNLVQIIVGGVVGISLSAAVRRFIPSLYR